MVRRVASCEWRVASQRVVAPGFARGWQHSTLRHATPRQSRGLQDRFAFLANSQQPTAYSLPGIFPDPQPPTPSPSGPRRGISLLEVLISMFVLLFGLMGVAAVFPVGNHYAGKGEQYDRGAALADQAFADLKARGMLNPWAWLYAEPVTSGAQGGTLASSVHYHVIHPIYAPSPGSFNARASTTAATGPGHAFVLDPIGVAEAYNATPKILGAYTFPFGQDGHPWRYNVSSDPRGLNGSKWPIRRISVPSTNPDLPTMTAAVAETITRLRDDMSNETPEQDDRPGILRFAADNKGTPNDPTDDIPLARGYAGSYSWIATIVPTAAPKVVGGGIDYPTLSFQPSNSEYSSALFDVSVAVFNKREDVPSAASERTITAEWIADRELVVFEGTSELVDAAVLDIRQSNWMLLAGVQPNGKLLLKWYKIQYIDDETTDQPVDAGTMPGRTLSLEGPDWPTDTSLNLQAIFMPGVIGVSTQSLAMERN